jgi:hypothetical protein
MPQQDAAAALDMGQTYDEQQCDKGETNRRLFGTGRYRKCRNGSPPNHQKLLLTI